MLSLFRHRLLLRLVSLYVISCFLGQMLFPTGLYALTGGPASPEFSSFEPVGTSELVNVATGDFVYNIPLLEVEGYPLNLAYHSGVSMDQEASAVGLGWTLNPGSLTRTMRGLPDDFKGERIQREFNLLPNQTWGLTGGVSAEVFGGNFSALNLNLSVYQNNYRGMGYSFGLETSLSAARTASFAHNEGLLPGLGLGFNYNSQSGIGLTPSLSFDSYVKKQEGRQLQLTQLSVAGSYYSRAGLQGLTAQTGTHTWTKKEPHIPLYGNPDASLYSYGGATGTALSFSTPTYTPQLSFPFLTHAIDFTVQVGPELLGLNPHLYLHGYVSRQELALHTLAKPAYGYLYAEETAEAEDVLLDMNREKDRPFIKGATTNLPLSHFTYDLYSATGQGVAGQFRPYRSDIGILYDDRVKSGSVSGSAGLEFGAGNLVKWGGNTNLTAINSHSSRWQQGDLFKHLHFTDRSETGDALYEPYYFKQVGEQAVVSDPDFYAHIGGEKAIRVDLGGSVRTKALNQFRDRHEQLIAGSNSYHRTQRNKRNLAFSQLNAREAKSLGLQKQLGFYTYDAQGALSYQQVERDHDFRAEHHLSELSVLRPDGARYVYGLPAYNREERAVSFNAAGLSKDCASGQVSYATGDNTPNNSRGIDHYFDATQTPAYAYQYLLTSVLSADYVDSDGIEGPSAGDMGTWHKLNYIRMADAYHWRVPFQAQSARYQEGFQSIKVDDKAHYLYGTKELYQVHSVESRHFIAEFTYDLSNPRLDSYGVIGEQGGHAPDQPLLRLASISLYAKAALAAQAQGGPPAVPIKQVHFEHDYSLCPGIDNRAPGTQGGKLTLKKLYFSYGNSEEGTLSPYEFYYADPDHDLNTPPNNPFNPAYDLQAYDRWGQYQPNTCNGTDPENGEFPYTRQEKIPVGNALNPYGDPDYRYADAYAQAWHLTSILTPTGAKMDISYEADDYAYVQNKAAMQMCQVIGAGPSPTATPTTPSLYSNNNGFSNHNYLFVALPQALTSSSSAERKAEFHHKYLRGIEQLYVNLEIDLSGKGHYEHVPAYVEIASYGTVDAQTAWIEVKAVGIQDDESGPPFNPLAKAGMNFTRLNLPYLVFPRSNPQALSDEEKVKALAAFAMDFRIMFHGYNKSLRNRGYCKLFNPHKSWLRLRCPDRRKHGGGVRVAKIELSDQWAEMNSGAPSQTYGQTYTYTTTNARGESISSGVAAYEPLIGGDENPFRLPRAFSKKNHLAPDDAHYLEEPFGESFFPGPMVIYSQVKVSSLRQGEVKRHATGHVIHEFYTARDFPTQVEETPLAAHFKRPNPILNWLKIGVAEYMTASQGYAIIRNDMHGKPKAQWVYAEDKSDPISGVEYRYRTQAPYSPHTANRLHNDQVPVIDPQGKLSYQSMGKEIDFVLDTREQSTLTAGVKLGGNLDAFFLFFFGAAIPSVWPQPISAHTRFRSVVATKVVDHFGILEETIAHDLGARISTRNTAFDAETGGVLLTETANEYKDPLYGFRYPAHWAYTGMGPAYRNIGANYLAFNPASPPAGATAVLRSGDELLLEQNGALLRAWVLDVSPSSLYLIDGAGNQLSGTFDRAKVIRSGARNLQSSAIGSLSTKVSPISTNLEVELNVAKEILAADAILYSDQRQVAARPAYVGTPIPPGCDPGMAELNTWSLGVGDQVNPYAKGLRGHWYPLRTYTYLSDRSGNPVSNPQTELREDGILVDFQAFWQKPVLAGDLWQANSQGWTYVEEVSKLGAQGYSLENKDALGLYASAQYGHLGQLPIAVVANARLNQVAYENFENLEGLAGNDEDPHMQFDLGSNASIAYGAAHSGKACLEVAPSSSSHEVRAFHRISAASSGTSGGGTPFILQEGDIQGIFAPNEPVGGPEGPAKYVASVWAKDVQAYAGSSPVFTYPRAQLQISHCNLVLSTEVHRSRIIEGWQKIEVEFTLPSSATANDPLVVSLKVAPGAPSEKVCFDDLRIHPFEASMQTYVYDPETLRLLATGDENSATTFYQYDQQGRLLSVKVETEAGIMTLQEARSHTHQQP